jgi:hypothetical protein
LNYFDLKFLKSDFFHVETHTFTFPTLVEPNSDSRGSFLQRMAIFFLSHATVAAWLTADVYTIDFTLVLAWDLTAHYHASNYFTFTNVTLHDDLNDVFISQHTLNHKFWDVNFG